MRRSEPRARPKLALLVNVIAPYRLPIYERLGQAFDTVILYSGREANRTTWSEVATSPSTFRCHRSRGLMLALRRRSGESTYDRRYLHISPLQAIDLLRERPDVIISNELGFRTLVAFTYACLFHRPLWVWWGGTLHSQRNVSPYKLGVRRALARRLPRWISYGRSSTRYLRFLGVPRERILEIQNCVDETRFSAHAHPLFPLQRRPVLLYVGQMIGRKGVANLLRAAAAVQVAGWEFSLLLVGDGPEKEKLQELASRLALRDVHFRPAQRPEAMPGVYGSGDVLVFPTLEDAWGLVVNEAILCGLRVLCSVYAGCAEELIPRSNRFDPTDPHQFEAALIEALSGKIAPPDPSRLRSVVDVADAIVANVRGTLGGSEAHLPGAVPHFRRFASRRHKNQVDPRLGDDDTAIPTSGFE